MKPTKSISNIKQIYIHIHKCMTLIYYIFVIKKQFLFMTFIYNIYTNDFYSKLNNKYYGFGNPFSSLLTCRWVKFFCPGFITPFNACSLSI